MTTEMISLWSMHGAAYDGDGEERSAEELRSALARRWTPSANDRPRIRGAGEDEWKPFLMRIEGDAESH